jgi:hypothetical protein
MSNTTNKGIVISKNKGKGKGKNKGPVLRYATKSMMNTIAPDAIHKAGNTIQSVCINILSAKIHADIVKAAAVKNGINTMFGAVLSGTDLQAMRDLASLGFLANSKSKADKLKSQYAKFIKESDIVRCISLQRLAKLAKGETAKKAGTVKTGTTKTGTETAGTAETAETGYTREKVIATINQITAWVRGNGAPDFSVNDTLKGFDLALAGLNKVIINK